MNLPKPFRPYLAEIEASGLPVSFSQGKRGFRLFLGGQLALSVSLRQNSTPRAEQNNRAHLRRAIRALAGA